MKFKSILALTTLILSISTKGGEIMNTQKNPKIAVTITLKAKPGKSKALSDLLASASAIVKKTEPETLYWFSTQVDENNFTINDGFHSEKALQAHFEGKVAAALKASSKELIVGGWEQGVLPNIQTSKVLSSFQ